jgi:glucose-1-phosphate adenylyltransferase
MQTGKHWYLGTADAVYQNLHLISGLDPEHVCVFGGDHIYKMDVRQMLEFHRQHEAKLTVAAIPVPVALAHEFGVIEVDANGKMIGFEEKPKSNPKTIPGRPDFVLASMGNYIFEAKTLVEVLEADAKEPDSKHDFGHNIIPKLYPLGEVYVYDFSTNRIRGEKEEVRGYWRDVGTIDSYYEANMDLISIVPPIDLYNKYWPMRSYTPPMPPAKFVHDEANRTGQAISSMVAAGCIVSGSIVYHSILGYNCHVHSHAYIEKSVLMGNNDIGRGCRIRRAIIDKDVRIAPGTVIGEDPVLDKQRFHVSPDGVVVIPKGAMVGFD